MRRISDSVLLSGWLFADLLLGLMVIFMVSIPGAIPRITNPPRLIISPSHLDPTSSACTGGKTNPACTVTVQEAATSDGGVNWNVQSDFSDTVVFSNAQGNLTPGKSITITISAIACQSGSFIFNGSDNTSPVFVPWSCVPLPERLERTYCRLVLSDQNPNTFSTNLQFAKSVLEPEINSLTFLHGRQVGIAIASGGVDDVGNSNDRDLGQNIATNTYLVLQDMANRGPLFAKASYYGSLFSGFYPSRDTIIDIYLIIRPDNANDTCGGPNHTPL